MNNSHVINIIPEERSLCEIISEDSMKELFKMVLNSPSPMTSPKDLEAYLDNMDVAPATVNIKGAVNQLLRCNSKSSDMGMMVHSSRPPSRVSARSQPFSPSSMFIDNSDFLEILGRISTTPSDSMFGVSPIPC